MRQSLDGGDDLASLVQNHEELGSEAAELMQPGVGSRRNSHGGGGSEAVAIQLEALREYVGQLP